jgi:hypothetical protein
MEHFFHAIPGWFDFANIYTDRVNSASNGAHFVELGAWKGKSAAYMAVEIANSGKKMQFDCVDIWNGAGAIQIVGHYSRKLGREYVSIWLINCVVMENGCVHQPSVKRSIGGVPASIMIIDHGSTQSQRRRRILDHTVQAISVRGKKKYFHPTNDSRAIAVHNMTTQLIDHARYTL